MTRDKELCCDITENPCGTDTWKVGHPCRCAGCALYLALQPPRPLVGFFATLTHEQQAAALAYDGPENFGDPNGPKVS